MLKNFFVIAIRSFLRQRLYSFINLMGLAAGLTCTLLIYLWVHDEISVDKFHDDSDKIFRIITNIHQADGTVITWPITPGPLADDIRENVAGVEWVARTMDNGNQLFKFDDKSFLETGLYADPEFLRIFSFEIISGTQPPLSTEKNWVAISNELAARLFGNDDAVGKSVNVANKYDLTVIAVFQKPDSRSSLQFEFLLPLEIYKEIRGDGFNWGNYDHPLYLKLQDKNKADEVLATINKRLQERLPDDLDETNSFYIQPFADKYLYSGFENGLPVTGRIKYVNIFSVVAIFILVIACINFMNMATARAVTRAKEVGVRKVVGAQRAALILQFLAESILVCAVAAIVALGIVYILLPLFNTLMGKDIVLDPGNPFLLTSLISIIIITGVMAGMYPAFFLSSYKPASVLKGSASSGFSGSSLRKALVVFQFSLTVILIVCALVVYNQINFIRKTSLGYNRSNLLTFASRGPIGGQFEAFRNEAIQIKGVKSISRANQSLVQVNNQSSSVNWPGKPDNSTQYFRAVVVDFGFLETMELKLTDGRFFSTQFNDTSNFVISQRAADIMGLTNPIGQKISLWGNEGTVVGIADDFHSRSLQEAIDPIVFYCQPNWTWKIVTRFESAEVSTVIDNLRQLYKKYSPEYPFEYTFVDEEFERLYSSEKVAGTLALSFTAMAVVISGLGLIGLAAYTAERRKKEISIRKTMGASIGNIISMMSQDFTKLSLLSIAIGCPVAYYLMQLFLEGYAYHTTLSAATFVITALLVLAFSLSTVIFQVLRAAMANPVDSLRNE